MIINHFTTAYFYIYGVFRGYTYKKLLLNLYYFDVAFLAAFSPANLPDVYANPKVPPSNIT